MILQMIETSGVAWTNKYEQLNEHEQVERKEGKRRDAVIVIGSLLSYCSRSRS